MKILDKEEANSLLKSRVYTDCLQNPEAKILLEAVSKMEVGDHILISPFDWTLKCSPAAYLTNYFKKGIYKNQRRYFSYLKLTDGNTIIKRNI